MSEKIAVIGAGVMGANHIRTAQRVHPDHRVQVVVDPDVDRAKHVLQALGYEGVDVTPTIDGIDGDDVRAAIIASPSAYHAEQAVCLLDNGVHVLIEKPVAASLDEAEAIRQAAIRNERVAMVGHVELFNPTVRAIRTLIGDRAITSLRLERLSEVTDRSRVYTDVVNDLMVHDMSIALRLVAGSYEANAPRVLAAHGRENGIASPDPAQAILEFGDGTDAYIRASRRYQGGKVRSIAAEVDNQLLTADLLARSITVTQVADGRFTPEGVYTEDFHEVRYYPQNNSQPLSLEQAFFIDAINGKAVAADEQVSVENAMSIMRLTDEVLRLVGMNKRTDKL